MHIKFPQLLAVLFVVNAFRVDGANPIRKTPKIYNALITTDENLTASRAYPVIQPTIHESGIIPPYPYYNPYGFYNPSVVRFGQPIAPGLRQRQQIPYPVPSHNPYLPQIIPQPPASAPPPPSEKSAEEIPSGPSAEQPMVPSVPPTAPEQKEMPKEKLPIPLNEFGLPPSLIPLNHYPPYANAYNKQQFNRFAGNLPPYGYNQVQPLVINPVTGQREHFLPPYDYYPSHSYPFSGPSASGPGALPGAGTPPQPQIPGAYPPTLPSASGPGAFAGSGPPAQPQFPQVPGSYPPPPPSASAAPAEAPKNIDDKPEETPQPPTEAPEPAVPAALPADAPSFESIKNGSKNNDVPDVPPPPIPTGADKTKQS